MAKLVEELLVIKVSYIEKNDADTGTFLSNEIQQAIGTVAQEVIESIKPGAIVEVETE